MSYPITEIFAWVVDDPTGTHGILGVLSRDGIPMQAVSSRFSNMIKTEMLEIATGVARETGRPVRLVRFTKVDAVVEVTADQAATPEQVN
jgi:hypothetical protein